VILPERAALATAGSRSLCRAVLSSSGLTSKPVGEHFAALAALRDAGLVRHLGLSNVNVAQIDEALAIAPVAAVQNRYSVDSRRPEADDVLRACAERGIAFVASRTRKLLSSAPWPDSSDTGQTDAVNERAAAQLRVIKAVVDTLEAVGISAWLFGGWGLDARIGRITREHGDVEFWVDRSDAERSRAVLIEAGATALATQPPEEACEFTWDGVDFSTAYFDRRADGSFIQLQGRWSDWLFPPGSFGDEPGTLDGEPVLTMSVAGMLAMKEQYPRLRNGGPWRQKDIDDIKVLRGLAARG
jgi:hypothetical protein